jgi:hypothetical protein
VSSTFAIIFYLFDKYILRCLLTAVYRDGKSIAMTLLEYIKTLEPAARQAFAKRAGTSLGYILQIAYGNKNAKAGTDNSMFRICEASEWKVRPNDLRPDVYPGPRDGMPKRAAA